MNKLDILAIGDIVIDAFIKVSDAEIIDIPKNKELSRKILGFRYGDKIPYDSVEICNAVGNASNASVSASRLGLKSGLLTYVGGDQNGKDCIISLQENNVDISLVHTEENKKTNYHYVLWYDVDRTILVKHEKFDYSLENIGSGENAPKWIYLSSLGEDSLNIYKKIITYLKDNTQTKLAFQPGVFDMKLGTEKLKDIYNSAEAICLNVEEAQNILNQESRDLKILLKQLSDLGPKKVFITDGFDGAYAYSSNEPDIFYFIPVYPHTPFERTGAGDAFFSTIISALSLGKNLEEALSWGPINSQSVVQYVGAQKGLLTHSRLEELLRNAPSDYKVVRI